MSVSVEKIDSQHPLADYLCLYDHTFKPMLDPCFYEYRMTFVCTHTKSIFKSSYSMSDQYCEECKAMREVKAFDFIGVPLDKLDYSRPWEIQLTLSEWDPTSKAGMYILCKPKQLPNGKFIKQIDYFLGGNFGIPTEVDKPAELARARISDPKCYTVFQIDEYSFNVPRIMEAAKRYLEVKDVRIIKMIRRNQKSDGTWNYDEGDIISDPKKIQIPTESPATG